ncbi:MAG: ABC transporter permease [Spirochaetales bacterium]|nr:ABC transporter permease [Spirochaetales bacterium]
MMRIISEIITIARREVIRGVREKSRLLGSLGRPFVWLFLLGTGLRQVAVSTLPAGVTDYQHFIFPGMIVMNILFASIMAGTSLIWDREFGFLKEILVAPVSRTSIALGKMFGGAALAVIQGALVFLFIPVLGIPVDVIRLLLVVPCLFLVASAITSLGMLIAVRMRSFEGFGIMNNFVVMPMFFLSGAMYSVTKVPDWLKIIIQVNPVNYAVDLIRSIFLGIPSNYNYLLDIVVLAGMAIVLQSIVVYLFHHEKG